MYVNKISKYSTMSESNQFEWNRDVYNSTISVHHLIKNASTLYKDDNYILPVEDDVSEMTFFDLYQFVLSMNCYLDGHGVCHQDRVAVILPNSTLMTLLFLSVVGSGRVFIPINPKSGLNEVEYILNATKPKIILVSNFTEEKVGRLYQSQSKVIENIAQFINDVYSYLGHDESNFSVGATDAAEIVFTSGTTGNPKGVVLTHQNILADSFGIGKMFDFNRGMRFLTTTPIFHNSGQIPTTMVPLWCGGTTTPIRPEVGLIKFDYFVDKFKINWSFVTPSFISFLMSGDKVEDISSLDGLFVGGAKLSPALMDKFENKFSISLYEAYGLTETTSFATCVQKDTRYRVYGSAGVPLFVNEIRINEPSVIDDSGYLIGEILIKGDNVFKEYLGQPELTVKKKPKDWFYSGDLGYVDDDNNLFVIDRIDNMIIVGGENVYPTEVERFVPNMEGIIDAVLSSRPHPILGNELVLVYEAKKGVNLDVNEWIKMLEIQVSSFKIPSVFINAFDVNDAGIPRADNGKVLRKKLRDIVKDYI